MMIAFIVVVGLFFLRLAFGIFILFISAVFSFIAWVWDKLTGGGTL